MKLDKCREIFNPYDWLPSYGENGVTFTEVNKTLFITISYEDMESDYEIRKRDIVFRSVYSFCVSSIPGPNFFEIEINDSTKGRPLGSMVEFEYSDISEKWKMHLNGPGNIIVKYFSMFFLSENKRIDVVAESVELSDSYV